MIDIDTASSWRGHEVVDRDGDKIGKLVEVYLDLPKGEPEWGLVKTGLFGTRQHFVPIGSATAEEGIVRVPYEKEQVKGAPSIEPDGQLSQTEEAELYRHYEMEYSEESSQGSAVGGERTAEHQERPAERTSDQLPAEQATPSVESQAGTATRAPGNGDDASVGRPIEVEGRPRERVRLKKYVVTEEVTKTVPVQREEIRVEREPVGEQERRD